MPKTVYALMKEDLYSDRVSVEGIFDTIKDAAEYLKEVVALGNGVTNSGSTEYVFEDKTGGWFRMIARRRDTKQHQWSYDYYCDEVEYHHR